jgi:hypothetical protein
VPGIANLDEDLLRKRPRGFVAEGRPAAVPALITQGFSDNLFNGNEGWHNFERTLTDEAREQTACSSATTAGTRCRTWRPAGLRGGSDACQATPAPALDFFEAVMAGDNPREALDARLQLHHRRRASA